MMKPYLIVAAAFVLPISAYAQTAKPCEELKSEIAKKLDANNVKSYSLEIFKLTGHYPHRVVRSSERESVR
jgi:hypothetical protein